MEEEEVSFNIEKQGPQSYVMIPIEDADDSLFIEYVKNRALFLKWKTEEDDRDNKRKKAYHVKIHVRKNF